MLGHVESGPVPGSQVAHASPSPHIATLHKPLRDAAKGSRHTSASQMIARIIPRSRILHNFSHYGAISIPFLLLFYTFFIPFLLNSCVRASDFSLLARQEHGKDSGITGYAADSGRRRREAPFGRQRGARPLRHSLPAPELRGRNRSILIFRFFAPASFAGTPPCASPKRIRIPKASTGA